MKKKFTIFITLMLLLTVFIIYKAIMLHKYQCPKEEIDTSRIFNETITINQETPNDSNYLFFENMSIKNYFIDYVDVNNETSFRAKYDENNKVVSFYSINSASQYINMLSVESFKLATDDDSNDFYGTDKSTKKFLDNHNIKNDVDLLKYIKENYYFKNYIFTSAKQMKINYLLNSFISVALPYYDSIVLIDGDIKGYIIDAKTGENPMKEIHILKDSKQYVILLGGSEIANKEFIVKLLSSVSFN